VEASFDQLRRQDAAYKAARCIVKQPGANGHWTWQRNLNGRGYAYVRVEGHDYLAVRVLWEAEYGPFSGKLRQVCTEYGCVKPDHYALI
jgi:hypothetical protein